MKYRYVEKPRFQLSETDTSAYTNIDLTPEYQAFIGHVHKRLKYYKLTETILNDPTTHSVDVK